MELKEYWLVNPEGKSFQIFHLENENMSSLTP